MNDTTSSSLDTHGGELGEAALPMVEAPRGIAIRKSHFPFLNSLNSGQSVRGAQNSTNNPMQPANLAQAPRCAAKTRTGTPCNSPAVRGRQRCRMHGGTNKGAPKRNRHAWRHGNRSAEAIAQLKVLSQTKRDLRLLTKLNSGAKLSPSEIEILFELSVRSAMQSAD